MNRYNVFFRCAAITFALGGSLSRSSFDLTVRPPLLSIVWISPPSLARAEDYDDAKELVAELKTDFALLPSDVQAKFSMKVREIDAEFESLRKMATE